MSDGSNESANFFEYGFEKKPAPGIKFFRTFYKFAVVLIVLTLDVLAVLLFKSKVPSFFVPSIFISPLFVLFISLTIIYFTNARFYLSYEYVIRGGVLKVTECQGSYVFGHKKKIVLLEKRISEIDSAYIMPIEDVDKNGIKNAAKGGLFEVCVLKYDQNGKTNELAIDLTDKLKSLLRFYNSSLLKK